MRSPERSRAGRSATLGLAVALGATALSTPASATPASATPATERISVNRAGAPGEGPSNHAAVSADGRFVTFHSTARNLIRGDDPGRLINDLFLRDRVTRTTERINVSSAGTVANASSFPPARISPDGRYVTFSSTATNLAPGDTGGRAQIYLRDRVQKTTRRVSVGSDGAAGNADTYHAAVSANGRYVAFSSGSTNLVDGDDNGYQDIFLRDVRYGTTRLVSVAADGLTRGDGDSISPVISDNGRFVGFESSATNLQPVNTRGRTNAHVKDLHTAAVELASVVSTDEPFPAGSGAMSMSADGQRVAFVTRTENPDGSRVYVRDRIPRNTVVASFGIDGAASAGPFGTVSISPNGRYVAFIDAGTDRILVRDLSTGTTVVGGADSSGRPIEAAQWPAMSNAGVAFDTFASDVVPGENPHQSQVYFRRF